MKLKGGYQVPVQGKPAPEIKHLPVNAPLNIPLFSKRFKFTSLKVVTGDDVYCGQIIAEDPSLFSTPLLSPCNGKVDLDTIAEHILIKPKDNYTAKHELTQSSESILTALLNMGVWPFICNALSGDVVDPSKPPTSIIIPVFSTESFSADPSVYLPEESNDFLRGLKLLTQISGIKNVFIVIPDKEPRGLEKIIKEMKNLPQIKIEKVPSRYPFDNHKLLAQSLLPSLAERSAAWHIYAQGVSAAARAYYDKEPFVLRTISTGGPGFTSPAHLRVPLGYPLDKILLECGNQKSTSLIWGGIFSGVLFPEQQKGIDVECQGITSVPIPQSREVLAFANPGFSKHSYGRIYLSLLRPSFKERSTTSIRGEHRPCVSCGFCENICPARLLPFQIHRYAQADMLEDLQRMGIERCVQCGLCTYVCPSKRDVITALSQARTRLQEEFYPEEKTGESVTTAY